MDKKCVECGGELIEGKLAGMHASCFYPNGEFKKMKPKYSQTVCYCCKKCGLIQNIRAIDIDKIADCT